MSEQSERQKPAKKPELTDADKALLEAEPDWERMGEGARRLLGAKSDFPKRQRRPSRIEPQS